MSIENHRSHPYFLRNNNGLPQSYRHKLRHWLLTGLAVSMAAVVGVLPLLLLHFNRIATLSPIATILIEPFLCLWALTMGLFACLLLPLSPWLASLLLHLGSLGLHSALFLANFLAALPFASLRLATPTPTEVFLYYAALIAFSQRHRFKLAPALAMVAIISLATTLIGNSALASRNKLARINILDVGQGSAIVLELPGHRAILIDGGSYLGEHFDVGERIIAPFLWQRRINRLEAVVISHPHADHYNGLPFILRNFNPKTLWTNGRASSAADYQHLLREAEELGIAVKTPLSEQPLYADHESKLYGLGLRPLTTGSSPPPTTAPYPTGTATNRHSLVLRLIDHGRSFLFPGDIDAESEQRLAQIAGGIKADVLVAPHHGSGGSSSDSFMKAVSPEYIVVSAGTSRPGGMAEKDAVQKWQHHGATVFDTAIDGTVSFSTDGAILEVSTVKQAGR
ncbi:ComEC/Rec2 family competence protein [Thermodesulfobacteriota bacterium]